VNRTRLVCAASVLAAWLVGAAHAETPDAPGAQPSEVVSTASAKDAPKDSTAAQIADWIKGPPLARVSDDDSDGVITAAPDRGVHGEGGVFVTNFGYGGYVAATMPVGKDATLGLAVQDTQFNGRYLRGSARSAAASLALGQPADRPAGCPAAVRLGDRYVEPLWASQLRGAPLTDDPDGCHTPLNPGR
jgi:hypothetical protein